MADEFEKDFGYLMPFLEKIATAANGFSDVAARKELQELVAGEKVRWTRIRELLGGSAEKATSSSTSAAHSSTAAGTATRFAAPAASGPPAPQFTVGRLRGRDSRKD